MFKSFFENLGLKSKTVDSVETIEHDKSLETSETSQLTPDYETLISTSSVQELKRMHEQNPLCTNCDENSEIKSILRNLIMRDGDLDKIKFLMDDLSVGTKVNLNVGLDVAIEEGDLEKTKYFISKGASCSRYAKQMAVINKNYKTFLYADSYANERSNTGIEAVHKKFTKDGSSWAECIPEEYRY